eukprot:scaffold25497_cov68-Cyclotella_meneghiniana.AAC.2
MKLLPISVPRTQRVDEFVEIFSPESDERYTFAPDWCLHNSAKSLDAQRLEDTTLVVEAATILISIGTN